MPLPSTNNVARSQWNICDKENGYVEMCRRWSWMRILFDWCDFNLQSFCSSSFKKSTIERFAASILWTPTFCWDQDHSTFSTESSVYSFRTMLYIWKLNGRKQSIEVAAELVMIHSYRVGYRTDNESIIFFSLFFMLLCCDKICQQINVMRMTNGMNESTATSSVKQ